MINIDNLRFSYGSNCVLDGITMTLEPGRIYGLLGENGVGKTTLLTLICGLKNTQSGSISIDGRTPYKREPVLLSEISYIPDEVAPLHCAADSWAKSSGIFRPNFKYEKFLQIANEFEIDVNMMMDKMSNGQLKKTYISFVLACGTRYILMDEPTNGLDIPSKAQFRTAIMKHTSEDSTIVISTHQVRDLENIIDPVIILDRQAVLLNATISEISSKLYFDYGTEIHPDNLYMEQLPGGFIQVRPNTTGEESKVNIEALFNAVHKHKDLIKAMFSHE